MTNKKGKQLGKLVLTNLFVFVGLLLVVDFLIIGGLTIQRVYAKYKPAKVHDARAKLPNYKNIPWAATYFEEDGGIEILYYSHYTWRRKPFHGRTINISDEGIRVTPQSASATAGKPLVALMGGSTMWGIGANDETTIPAYLAVAGKGQFSTVNFAEVGYDAYQSSLFLHEQILKGNKPAVVVSYDGVNNKYFQGREDYSDFYENDIRAAVEKARIKQEDRLSFKNWFFGPIQVMGTKIKARMQGKENASPVVPISREAKIQKAKELLEGWLATANECEQNNIQYLLLLQPQAFTGSPDVKHLTLAPQIKEDLSYYPFVLQLIDDARYAKVKSHFHDLTHVLDKQAVYIDFCHTDPTGNRILADSINVFLKEMSL